MKIPFSVAVLSLALRVALAQAPQTPASQSPSNAKTQSQNTAPVELKTQTYKGMLLDATCAGTSSCSVSSATKEFALKTNDGRTLPFDTVGNDRAQEAVKAKKKWSEAVSAGKPIQTTVSAAETGNKLAVLSIH